MRDKHEQEKSDWKLNLLIQKCITSVDANESLFESVLIFIDVLALDDFILSFLSLDLRTAPTRSLAKRDHDSIRLCASQQAAGVRPLIFICYQWTASLVGLLWKNVRPHRFFREKLNGLSEHGQRRCSENYLFHFSKLARLPLLHLWFVSCK